VLGSRERFGREHDDRDLTGLAILLELLDHCKPVHPWHEEI
jgi:hypothetical protein